MNIIINAFKNKLFQVDSKDILNNTLNEIIYDLDIATLLQERTKNFAVYVDIKRIKHHNNINVGNYITVKLFEETKFSKKIKGYSDLPDKKKYIYYTSCRNKYYIDDDDNIYYAKEDSIPFTIKLSNGYRICFVSINEITKECIVEGYIDTKKRLECEKLFCKTYQQLCGKLPESDYKYDFGLKHFTDSDEDCCHSSSDDSDYDYKLMNKIRNMKDIELINKIKKDNKILFAFVVDKKGKFICMEYNSDYIT